MASSKFSYQKLKKLPTSNLDHDEEENQERIKITRKRNWLIRLRKRRLGVRLSRSIGRLVRRKAKVMLRNAVKKVVKRLKEGRPYIGEIFAGNYMFMQVNPSTPSSTTASFTVGPTPMSYLPAAGAHFYSAAIVPPPLASSSSY